MEQNGQHKVNRDEGLGFKKMHIYLKEQKKKRYLLHAVVRTVYALNVVRELSHR
jgi:hypothetical protein